MESDYEGLIKLVSSQNNHIEIEINKLKDRHSTDDQFANYKNEQSEWFQYTNKMLLYLYLLLVIIFLLLIRNKKMSMTNKILITIGLFAFPFVINPTETILYNTLKYIWTFILCIEYPQ